MQQFIIHFGNTSNALRDYKALGPSKYTLTVNVAQEDATVVLTADGYTQTGNSITVEEGTTVHWEVSKDGFDTEFGDIVVEQDETLEISLEHTVYTLTINPNPADAIVTYNVPGYTQQGNSITVREGTEVAYTVSKSKYTTFENSVIVETDETQFVNLTPWVSYTVNPTPSDATVSFTTNEINPIREANTIWVTPKSSMNCTVSKDGYISQSSTISNLTSNQTWDVELVQLFTLTINPNPADATVELIADGFTQNGNSITVANGTEVYYTVSKDNYVEQSGSVSMISNKSLDIELELDVVTLTINATPSDATVTLTADGYEQVGNSITVKPETEISYTVSKDGYEEFSSSIILSTSESIDINLLELFTLTINPTPADATVVLLSDGYEQVGNSITIASGKQATYSVVCEGYDTVTETLTLTQDQEINVEMELSIFTLTVNPIPAETQITLTATGYEQVGNSITAPYGTSVSINARHEEWNYSVVSSATITKTETIDVEIVGPESFKFTVNSGSNSSFILPLSSPMNGSSSIVGTMTVDWGDGNSEKVKVTNSTMTSICTSNGTGMSHTYPAANTNYQITLTSGVGGEKFKSFGFNGAGFTTGRTGCNTQDNKNKVISLDSPLPSIKQFIKNGETAVDNVFAAMFSECQNLTLGSEFTFPQNIKVVGNNFAKGMFNDCVNLKLNSKFNLPQDIETAGNHLFSTMFRNCKSITNFGTEFQLPQNLKSVGSYCFNEMFNDCKGITTTNSVFKLPQNLTSVGTNFCNKMFGNCINLLSGVNQFFGTLQLSQNELNKSNVFFQAFYNTYALNENINSIPMLSTIPTNTNDCFIGIKQSLQETIPNNWGGYNFGDFKFTINSGSDSSFIVPMCSSLAKTTVYVTTGSSSSSTIAVATPPSYKKYITIDWGDGTKETLEMVHDKTNGAGYTHTYPTANTDYQITLSGSVGYLDCFGFYSNTAGCNVSTNKEKMKTLDTPLTKYMFLNEYDTTVSNFCWGLFYGCTNLTMGNDFNLPQDILNIGSSAFASMFNGCTNLTMGDNFNLPQSLTLAGQSFCSYMFKNCTTLQMNDIFNIPQNVKGTGNRYYWYKQMFYNCLGLTQLNSVFNMSQAETQLDKEYGMEMFAECRNLTTLNDIFCIPQNASIMNDTGASYDNIFTKIFYYCEKLTGGVKTFFGNVTATKVSSTQFNSAFYMCAAMEEDIRKGDIPLLNTLPSSTNKCFSGGGLNPTTKFIPELWGGYGYITLTINPTPADATVELTCGSTQQEGNSISVSPTSVVKYYIEKDGYITKTGNVVGYDDVMDIVLKEEVMEFKFTINTLSSTTFTLPMSSSMGYGTTWNLDIDWGDGTQTIGSTGSCTTTSGVTHEYPAQNTDYQITLSGDVGFLKQFGFYNTSASANKSKFKSLDSEFTLKMFGVEKDGANELFMNMFAYCANLTMGPDFNLPQDILTIGDGFCQRMFYQCTNIEMNDVFNLPPKITSAGNSFCQEMFSNCRSSTSPILNSTFNLPQNMKTVGTNYCYAMFYNSNVVLNNILKVCASNSNTNFCSMMFYNCDKITTGVKTFFGTLFNTEKLDVGGVYYRTFYDCDGITEGVQSLSPLQMLYSPTTSNQCFTNCSTAATSKCPANWK